MKKFLKSALMLTILLPVVIVLVACGSKDKGPQVPGWVHNIPSDMANVSTYLGEQGLDVITADDIANLLPFNLPAGFEFPAGIVIGVNEEEMQATVVVDFATVKALVLETAGEMPEDMPEDVKDMIENLAVANLINTMRDAFNHEEMAEVKAMVDAVDGLNVRFDSNQASVAFQGASIIVLVKGDIMIVTVDLNEEAIAALMEIIFAIDEE